jgi:hypothetical protein
MFAAVVSDERFKHFLPRLALKLFAGRSLQLEELRRFRVP